jgi:putative transposase
MPSRNILKVDTPESYYHVYFRGTNGIRIFRDAEDFEKMLQLFARYLSPEEVRNSAGLSFPNYYNKLELLAFCLMSSYVHLFVYQRQKASMKEFMRSILTSYSMYFNKKYKRTGPLMESRYKASRISDDSYLEHVSRYIHLAPRQWRTYEYSSLPYYLQQVSDEWILPRRITDRLPGVSGYLTFMADRGQTKEMVDILKHELADGADA